MDILCLALSFLLPPITSVCCLKSPLCGGTAWCLMTPFEAAERLRECHPTNLWCPLSHMGLTTARPGPGPESGAPPTGSLLSQSQWRWQQCLFTSLLFVNHGDSPPPRNATWIAVFSNVFCRWRNNMVDILAKWEILLLKMYPKVTSEPSYCGWISLPKGS